MASTTSGSVLDENRQLFASHFGFSYAEVVRDSDESYLEANLSDATRYIPGKEMNNDEDVVKYKDWVFFWQYMQKKPTKWGIKEWMLAE